MQEPIESKKNPGQPAKKPLRAPHARQWAVATGLAVGGAVAAAVMSFAFTPAAHADDIDGGAAQSAADTILGLVNEISGVTPISSVADIGSLQSQLTGDVTNAEATATSDPTVSNIANLLQAEAQLNGVNSAVVAGNATYISQADSAAEGTQIDSNEVAVVGSEVQFESDIANFYQNLPGLLTTADNTDQTAVSAITDALDDQTNASTIVANPTYGLGSVNEIGIGNTQGVTTDNLLLVDYDTGLYNYTGWLTDVVALENAV